MLTILINEKNICCGDVFESCQTTFAASRHSRGLTGLRGLAQFQNRRRHAACFVALRRGVSCKAGYMSLSVPDEEPSRASDELCRGVSRGCPMRCVFLEGGRAAAGAGWRQVFASRYTENRFPENAAGVHARRCVCRTADRVRNRPVRRQSGIPADKLSAVDQYRTVGLQLKFSYGSESREGEFANPRSFHYRRTAGPCGCASDRFQKYFGRGGQKGVRRKAVLLLADFQHSDFTRKGRGQQNVARSPIRLYQLARGQDTAQHRPGQRAQDAAGHLDTETKPVAQSCRCPRSDDDPFIRFKVNGPKEDRVRPGITNKAMGFSFFPCRSSEGSLAAGHRVRQSALDSAPVAGKRSVFQYAVFLL